MSPSARYQHRKLRASDIPTNGDVVIVIDSNQIAELQMASKAGCFTSNAFLSTAIAEKHVGVVVNQIVARLVEFCSRVCLSNGKTNSITKALSKGPRGDLNARRVMRLRMAGGDAIDSLSVISIGLCRIWTSRTRNAFKSSIVSL